MPIDIPGILRAYSDRQRARLEIPSAYDEEDRRQKNKFAAEDQATQLELAPEQLRLAREQTENAALLNDPSQVALRNRLAEAQIRNLDEVNTGAFNRPTFFNKEDDKGIVRVYRQDPMTGAVTLAADLGQVGQKTKPSLGSFASPMWVMGPGGVPVMVNRRDPGGGVIPGTEGLAPPSTATQQTELDLVKSSAASVDAMKRALSAVKMVKESEGRGGGPAGAGGFIDEILNPSTGQGPIAGRVGNLYRSVVDSSGPAGDFDNAASEARTVIYSLSGKQLNQSELDWLDQLTPNLRDPGVEQKLARFERFVSLMVTLKAKGYSGRNLFLTAKGAFDADAGPDLAGSLTPASDEILAAPPKAKSAVPGEAAGLEETGVPGVRRRRKVVP